MFSEVDLWPTKVAHIESQNHDLIDSAEKLTWSHLRTTSQWAPSQYDWALLAHAPSQDRTLRAAFILRRNHLCFI